MTDKLTMPEMWGVLQTSGNVFTWMDTEDEARFYSVCGDVPIRLDLLPRLGEREVWIAMDPDGDTWIYLDEPEWDDRPQPPYWVPSGEPGRVGQICNPDLLYPDLKPGKKRKLFVSAEGREQP